MSSPFAIAFLAKNPTPKTEEQKKKEEEEKRLDAVASINDRYVVSSGGVDLGTIKSKKKK